jgi:hypothetical protein
VVERIRPADSCTPDWCRPRTRGARLRGSAYGETRTPAASCVGFCRQRRGEVDSRAVLIYGLRGNVFDVSRPGLRTTKLHRRCSSRMGRSKAELESGRSENSPRSLPHHARRRSHVAACSKETAVGDWPGQGVAGPGRATVLSFSTNAGVSR